jgi:hypothetical protein
MIKPRVEAVAADALMPLAKVLVIGGGINPSTLRSRDQHLAVAMPMAASRNYATLTMPGQLALAPAVGGLATAPSLLFRSDGHGVHRVEPVRCSGFLRRSVSA